MDKEINLPPEMQSVLEAMSGQPPHARSMFRYALVLTMIDDGKAQVLARRMEDKQEILTVQTIVGDEFEILRPAMSEETEAYLLQQIREIVAEDRDEPSL